MFDIILQQVIRKTVGVSYSLAIAIWLMALLAGGLGGYLYSIQRRR